MRPGEPVEGEVSRTLTLSTLQSEADSLDTLEVRDCTVQLGARLDGTMVDGVLAHLIGDHLIP